MEKLFNSTSMVIGVAGGVATWMFGDCNVALTTLIVVIVLDYITGLVKGAYTGKLSSEIGYKGILKKVMMLLVVALAYRIQMISGDNLAIREVVILFFIANEGISILENAAVLLPNLPKKLRDILLQLRGDDDEDRH